MCLKWCWLLLCGGGGSCDCDDVLYCLIFVELQVEEAARGESLYDVTVRHHEADWTGNVAYLLPTDRGAQTK